MNVWEVMQQELGNLYQFLYHMTPVFSFKWKAGLIQLSAVLYIEN